MNMVEKNLKDRFERNLKAAVIIFSIFLMCGTASQAQNINNDLKSKQPIAKPKSTVKPTAKTVKKPSSAPAKKSIRPRVKSSNNTAAAASSVPVETPDQILNRFMNFQQSASVTDKDWNSVIAQTAKTLQDNPNNATAKAQSLIAQGELAYNQRNYALAMTQFKSVLQILPQSSLPHYSLGKAYLANGQAKAAERSFKQATDLNEKFALAYKGVGDALAAQGEKKNATKYFKKATEIGVKAGNMAP